MKETYQLVVYTIVIYNLLLKENLPNLYKSAGFSKHKSQLI